MTSWLVIEENIYRCKLLAERILSQLHHLYTELRFVVPIDVLCCMVCVNRVAISNRIENLLSH